MKKNTLFAIILLLAMGCEQNDQESCLQGTILKYNCCVGATSISLRSYVPYSKTITENGHTYHNVIIVAGHVEGTEIGEDIFLHVRKYKPQKDSNLLDGMCLCAIHEGDYPSYVITAFSPNGCP